MAPKDKKPATRARRGHTEGSIHRHASTGLYVAMIDLGIVNGKRKRKAVYAKTKAEVREKLRELQYDQHQGLPIDRKRQTVAQYLTRWLEDKIVPNRRPNTVADYTNHVRKHIIPQIGHIQLAKLTPQDVEGLIQAVARKGLSVEMQRGTRKVLRSALTQAMKWGFVVRNVASLTDAPAAERFRAYVLTVDQADALLDAAAGDRLHALYATALWLGLRRGELLGLRWQDIDLDAGTLRIEVAQQIVNGKAELAAPKTIRSRRTLPLPAALVPILQAHHTRQLKERVRAGVPWPDHDLVFTTTKGTPINPRNLDRSFKALLKRAGLPKTIRLHDLRHSCASLLASAGLPARVAMDILGHTNISTTMNIYTRIFDDAKREAADVMDRLFGGSAGSGRTVM